jgi:hypothetical protein
LYIGCEARGIKVTKATFTATPIVVIPDGWEKDWTVVLRVPAKEWEKMKWLQDKKQVVVEARDED